MNRKPQTGRFPVTYVPRARGDEPARSDEELKISGRSPRARG